MNYVSNRFIDVTTSINDAGNFVPTKRINSNTAMIIIKSHTTGWLLICVVVLTSFQAKAQRYIDKNNVHAILYLGSSHFFGDIGGKSTSTLNSLYDLNVVSPAYGIGVRKKASKKFSLRASYFYTQLKGDDAVSSDRDRRKRNLNFRTPIHEVSLVAEYKIATLNKRKKTQHYFHVFAGVGLFYFNPQGELNGKWYELQPLSTEGQGIRPGSKEYNRLSLNIPIGISYNVKLTPNSSMGITATFRKSFTDNLDDVNGYYYSNAAISKEKGAIAAQLADKSINKNGGFTIPEGALRGQPSNNDNFAFFNLSYTRSFFVGKTKTNTNFYK